MSRIAKGLRAKPIRGLFLWLLVLTIPDTAFALYVSVSPSGVNQGQNVTVYWSGGANYVDIYLYDGTAWVSTLAVNQPIGGSLQASTSGLAVDSDYRIWARDASVGAWSGYFSVSLPVVSVSPTEVLAGVQVQATWSGFGGNVVVELYNGTSWSRQLAYNVAGAGSLWVNTSGLSADTDWRIRVQLYANGSIYGYSEDILVRNPSVSASPGNVLEGASFSANWSGFVTNVDVEIWKGASYWRTERTNYPGSGSVGVNTTGWEPRPDYRVRVVLVANPGISSYSGYVAVSDPAVTVSPGSVVVGGVVQATWSGFASVVNVELYKGGVFWRSEITNAPGSYSRALNTSGWEVRSDYRVKVILVASTGIYAWSPSFAVTAPPPPQLSNLVITNIVLNSHDWVKNGDRVIINVSVSNLGVYQPGDITADLSGLGGSAATLPVGFGGSSATWDRTNVICNPGDGPIIIEVTATNDYGASVSARDTIFADNTIPEGLSGLTAAPGHRSVSLAWNDASACDANYDRVVIRCVKWSGYPGYDGPAPPYPSSPSVGISVFSGSATDFVHSFATDDRGIYRYAGFVLDKAGNIGAPSAGAGLAAATNYVLGDVGTGVSGPYDGLVTVADHTGLASTYGLIEGDPLFKSECDVGPTEDYRPTGIPVPDGVVGFEDLVMFAMNYEAESLPRTISGTAEPNLVWEQVDDRIWSLRLIEPCANLKALHITGELAAGTLPEIMPGELLAAQAAPVFLRNIDRLGLDTGVAILGRGVGLTGSGELLRMRLAEGTDLVSTTIQTRGIDNTEMVREPRVPTVVPVPVAFNLAQNVPNPFNPQTRIRFDLPQPQSVRLAVYSLDGRLVQRLVAGTLPAGRHEAIWDGRDDAGRRSASGTYIYRLDAGSYREMRKMNLMK